MHNALCMRRARFKRFSHQYTIVQGMGQMVFIIGKRLFAPYRLKADKLIVKKMPGMDDMHFVACRLILIEIFQYNSLALIYKPNLLQFRLLQHQTNSYSYFYFNYLIPMSVSKKNRSIVKVYFKFTFFICIN